MYITGVIFEITPHGKKRWHGKMYTPFGPAVMLSQRPFLG